MTISTAVPVVYRDGEIVIDLEQTADRFEEMCRPLIEDVLAELNESPSMSSDWMGDFRDTFLRHLKDHCDENDLLHR